MHKPFYTLPLFGRRLLLVLSLFILLAAGCGGDVELTETEEAEIYAAVIREIYTEDDTFGGTLQPDRLYVVGRTDDRAGDPSLEAGESAVIAEGVRQGIVTELGGLPAQIIWVEAREEVELDPASGEVAGGGAIITLGNIDPQNADEVYVPSSIYVAGLAAGGQTYVVENVEGTWTVTGDTGASWIS